MSVNSVNAREREEGLPVPLTSENCPELRASHPPLCVIANWCIWLTAVTDVTFLSSQSTEPLQDLWKRYATELLTTQQKDPAKVSRMDLHGAQLRITRSKCPRLVGLRGVVVKETENTFVAVDGHHAIRGEA